MVLLLIASGAIALSQVTSMKALIVSMRGSDERKALISYMQSAGISAVEFVEAVSPGNMEGDGGCLSSLNFTAFTCNSWRALAMKKAAQTCSHIRAMQRAMELGTEVMILEDDVKFFPAEANFSQLSNLLHDHLRERQGPWDLILLGSCLERMELLRSCQFIGDGQRRLWLTAAVGPACTHGLVVNPAGAQKLTDIFQEFRRSYHDLLSTSVFVEHPKCQTRKVGGRRSVVGRSLEKINGGYDQAMRTSIKRGNLTALEVWPVLAYQQERRYTTYGGRIPRSCRGTGRKVQSA